MDPLKQTHLATLNYTGCIARLNIDSWDAAIGGMSELIKAWSFRDSTPREHASEISSNCSGIFNFNTEEFPPYKYSCSEYAPAILIAILVWAAATALLRRKHRSRPEQSESNPDSSSDDILFSEWTIPGGKLDIDASAGFFGIHRRVFRGTYKETPTVHKQVAVKILRAQHLALNAARVHSLCQMQHPNILEIFGIGREAGSRSLLSVVSPWQVRGSLYDHLKINTLSYCQLLHLSCSIADGLAYLHAAKTPSEGGYSKPAMAHRNIKSKNIILRDDRTACIADFDSTIVYDSGTTAEEMVIGSFLYWSPELLEGGATTALPTRETSQAADIYAVTLVLWEALSRTAVSSESSEYVMPFEDTVGPNPSLLQMREIVVSRRKRPIIERAWREDDRFSPYISLLELCWDQDPRIRYSAGKLHRSLRLFESAMVSPTKDKFVPWPA
ncbi:activin receptor type-2A-like [Galendromus occidentalis]|uniref:receptor protein serine/threonine kinase n=1 Tax=Galendromus occidentalis TaxID=34638 RepID=A0AAJ6QY99_9ACAR|nr:activin receptor type-2A-like [Galendromus occidentalis]